MSLSSSFTTTADIDRLRAFSKLPENKEWLGRVARFYKKLETEAVISDFQHLYKVSQELLEIAKTALCLVEAATIGCDQDDAALVNRLSNELTVMFNSRLSPEMAAAAAAKGKA